MDVFGLSSSWGEKSTESVERARAEGSGGAGLDPRHPGEPAEDECELEDLLDAAQPGWRNVLIRRQYLPRVESVGTLPIAKSGGFAGCPGPRVPGIEDLYLAGDWVGPEGFLVDASLASARRAGSRWRTARRSEE
jgi:hypothetical protein